MARKTWILGTALTLCTSLTAWAGSPEDPRERLSLEERLELSREQAEEWHALRAEQEKAAVQRFADRRKLHIELRELLTSPTLNEGAVRAKARQLAELQAATTQQEIEARLALRKLLTPEQAERLRELKLDRGPRHEPRRPRGRRAPHGAGDEGPDEPEGR